MCVCVCVIMRIEDAPASTQSVFSIELRIH